MRAAPYALRLAPWGLAAAAVLGGAALYLYRRQSGEVPATASPQPLPEPLEARPPRDESDDEEEESSGRRRERPKGKDQRPEPEGEGTPPPGGMRDLTDFELKKAAKADGYDSVERWK